MASSMYQNPGPGRPPPPPPPPPGTYRQSNPPPPPPPSSSSSSSTGQYSSYNSYQQGSGFAPGQNAPSGQQMGYGSSYGYPGGAQGGSYGPPGVNPSQSSQYPRPPLPSYPLQSPPPPPPPPPPGSAMSGAPPLPPQPPPPAPLPPPLPPPPPHGAASPYPSSSSSNNNNSNPNASQPAQAYQDAPPHSQYYPQNMLPHQLPPPPPLPTNYSSSSSANVTTGTNNRPRHDAFKPASGYPPQPKQGNVGTLEKAPVPKAAKLPPPGMMAHKGDNRHDMDRERKKREYERKKMEEKKEVKMPPANAVIHKFPPAGTPLGKQSAAMVSRDGRPDLRKDKFDNRLKRPSTFVCKIKFRNELPDPISQPKLLQVYNDKDRYCRYRTTSLELTQKHRLVVDTDLGIPLDLLDISVYNPPKVRPPMDPEDEELLRDDEKLPSARTEIVRKKDRPTDKGVAWLVKTQYISPISLDPAKQALTEKQAKELKEIRDGKKDMLENLNDREQQIRSIQESFRIAQQTPVHQSKPGLKPVEILPLLPDFIRWESKFMHMTFDGEPTADSELHSKLDHTIREELEGLGILKTFNVSDPETGKQERFLAYMVPKVEELNSDTYEEMTYSWVREYHSEARPEETQNFSTYVFALGDGVARYLPLRQRISLQKKKSKERSKEEGDNAFAIPSRVTVRREEVEQEDEEAAARRLASSTNESRNNCGPKRRQSDGGGFSAPSKRGAPSKKRALSDDDDASYISS